jgi:hypothetical protein
VRATAVIVCLLAVLVAGCGGDGSEEALDPRTLVLATTDVGPGFEVDETLTGPVSNAEVARGRPAGYEAKLEEWGRTGGFARQVRREGKAGSGVRAADGVNSVASVYEDEDGASESFATGVRDYGQAGFAPQGELGIGDEGRIFRGTATLGGRQVEYTVATWRRARVIASVVVEGDVGRVSPATLKDLARKQDRRIDAALDA